MYLGAAGLAFGVPAGLLSTPKAALVAIFAYGAGILAFAIGYREPLDRELTLVNVLMVVAAPIALYAVLQSVLPLPRSDEVWLQSVDFVSAGNQAEGTLRSFATLNSPGTLATVLGLAIVFLLTTRRFNVLQVGILLLLLAGVSVTLVRSVWIALAVALLAIVIVAPSRAGPARPPRRRDGRHSPAAPRRPDRGHRRRARGDHLRAGGGQLGRRARGDRRRWSSRTRSTSRSGSASEGRASRAVSPISRRYGRPTTRSSA